MFRIRIRLDTFHFRLPDPGSKKNGQFHRKFTQKIGQKVSTYPDPDQDKNAKDPKHCDQQFFFQNLNFYVVNILILHHIFHLKCIILYLRFSPYLMYCHLLSEWHMG